MSDTRTENQQAPSQLTPAQKLEECRKAGHWIEWVDCWNGCDEGWHTDLHEIDPLWYDEDDMERCDICKGHGGWQLCFTCNPEAARDQY
jgi:hypothetical protein